MFRAPGMTEVLVDTHLSDLQKAARHRHLIATTCAGAGPRRLRRAVGTGLMSVGARLAGAEAPALRPATAAAGRVH